MPTPERKTVADTMRSDAEKAYLTMSATALGYTADDIDKLYAHYGPYAAKLFEISKQEPITFKSVLNKGTIGQAYTGMTATDELLKSVQEGNPPLTAEQIGRIFQKTELEVISNINEYKQQQEKRKQIDSTYTAICDGQDKPSTSVESLLAAGVKAEDFQAVFDKNPDLLGQIGGGPTCAKLAKAADKVVTKYRANGQAITGNCKLGVDTIHSRADLPTDSLHTAPSLQAIEYDRMLHSYQGKARGGCNVDEGLLASGDYIIVDVENTAYLKNKNGPENKEMNQLFLTCQPGVTMTVDAVDDRSTAQAKTAGGKYGHTAVKTSKTSRNPWACDFAQNDINFARYGKTAHVCFPKDAEASAEYAKMLIEQTQERTGQCLNVEENRKLYEADKKVAEAKTRTAARQQSATPQTATPRRRTTVQQAARRSNGR